MTLEARTVYFDNPGGENTEATLGIAKKRAEELGIKTIVVASTKGYTAVQAMDVFQGYKVIIVATLPAFMNRTYSSLSPNTGESSRAKGA